MPPRLPLGYPSVKGHRFAGEHFAEVFKILTANGLDDYDMILTGYMGLPEGTQTVAEGIKALKSRKPTIFYVMDPVLGDNGRLYLPPEMIIQYRLHFLPLADIIAPNQFEAETLMDMKIASAADGLACARSLAKCGPSLVAITTLDTPDVASSATLALLIYSAAEDAAWIVSFPRLPAHFTGTGDLFSALITAAVSHHRAGASTLTGDDFVLASARAVWVMQQVLAETERHSRAILAENDDRAAVLRKRELRTIHCKNDIAQLLTVTPEAIAGAEISTTLLSNSNLRPEPDVVK